MARDNDRERRDRDRDKRDRDSDKRNKDRVDRDRRSDRSRSPRYRIEKTEKIGKERERSNKSEKREKDRDRKKELTGSKKNKKDDLDLEEIVNDKELMTQRLDEEMQKRREKAEKWRQARKQMEGQEGQESEIDEEASNDNKKSWTLDDDDLDDTDNADTVAAVESKIEEIESESEKEKVLVDKMETNESEETDEIDPLDAFMSELNKDAKKDKSAGKARVVVIKTQKQDAKDKGDIVENEDDNDYVVDDFDMEQAASSLLAKGRMLAQTDHNKVYYRPFRKNFYIEVPEIAKMTKKEVEEYKEELDGIRVRGKKCPKPIKTWSQCGVEFVVVQALKKYNYLKPTPIQTQAIPAIMSGRDVIGIAKTGSGKTLAFLLPMFRHMLDQPSLDEEDGPIALIMSPTRELALQTWKEANKFAKPLDIRVVCVYGGVGISEQIADLKKGAEVIVCTPGRMIDMLAANNGKVTNLRRVTYLVLDEADRMFDMGFEPQVMKIVNNIRPDRQTVLFSATFPKQMEALARKILDQPIEIQVGGKSVVCADVEQHAMIVEEHVKLLKLLELLGQYWEYGNVLVFVDKQEKADDLVTDLMKAGYNCAPLHGGIDQFDRDSTIIDFKAGKLKLMVATSVAARGLDVKKLILVVNYDCPNHYEDYVHRVGRTGRAGNKGFSYTFILPEGQEKMAGEVCRAFETAGCEPPAELKEMWNAYRKKMKEQGVDVFVGSGGFSGHGYKYDAVENETEANKRKLELLVHSDQNDADIEEQFTSMMKSRQRISYRKRADVGKAGKAAAGSGDRIAAARAAAEKLAVDKQLNAMPIEKDAASITAEAVMKGTEAAPVTMTPIQIAKQKAANLNERLDYLPTERSPFGDLDQPLQYFEEELEINDFPQQIRYKICSRESIAQIQEFADVGVSVRGTHYPLGKEPKDGMDRKLYLFLESRDEFSLRRAKEEIIRIMRDAFKQLIQQGRQPTGGRYTVF